MRTRADCTVGLLTIPSRVWPPTSTTRRTRVWMLNMISHDVVKMCATRTFFPIQHHHTGIHRANTGNRYGHILLGVASSWP
jgi:hypothetical protein